MVGNQHLSCHHRPLEKSLLFVAFVWCILFSSWSRKLLNRQDDISSSSSSSCVILGSGGRKKISAKNIVEKAYKDSYATFLDCPTNQEFRDCILEKQHNHNNNTWPWWMQTLIRDAVPKISLTNWKNATLFGSWHKINITKPTKIQICVIEKVGTKQWRKFSCTMNNNGNNNYSFLPGQGINVCRLPREERSSFQNFAKVVFLRDPLERFLSGFLDMVSKKREIS